MRQAILLDGMPIERPVLMKWERLEAAPSWSERMVQAIEVRAQEEWFSLKDKMCSDIALSRAWARVRANAGAPGVDGVDNELAKALSHLRSVRLRAFLWYQDWLGLASDLSEGVSALLSRYSGMSVRASA